MKLKHRSFFFKTSIVISLIFIISTSFAQDTARDNAIHFGFTISPELAFRRLNALDTSSIGLTHYRDSIERPKLGYSFGAVIMYQINRRFSIEAGILYSEKGERTKYLDIIDTINKSNPLRKLSTSNKYTYIDIPLKFCYYFSEDYYSPYISLGFSTNIFLFEKKTYDYKYTDGTFVENSAYVKGRGNFYTINPQIKIAAGLDIILYESRIRIEPSFSYSLKNIDKSNIGSRLYSVGISLSYILNTTQREDSE